MTLTCDMPATRTSAHICALELVRTFWAARRRNQWRFVYWCSYQRVAMSFTAPVFRPGALFSSWGYRVSSRASSGDARGGLRLARDPPDAQSARASVEIPTHRRGAGDQPFRPEPDSRADVKRQNNNTHTPLLFTLTLPSVKH